MSNYPPISTSSSSAAHGKVTVKPKAKKRKKAAAKKPAEAKAAAAVVSTSVGDRLDRLERAVQSLLGIDLANHEAGPPVSSSLTPEPPVALAEAKS